MTDRPVRIANCSGFYGDRIAAAREVVDGGPLDVLTGDYLAELTMLILWKARRKDSAKGYATTFLAQMEEVLGTCLDRGIRIVANAGGLNPAGLAADLVAMADRLGLSPSVAHIEGDDLIGRLPELRAQGMTFEHAGTGRPLSNLPAEPVTANAYLGGWGITEALRAGADIVVCPRTTDAALTTGPAAWWHGWKREDLDALAGAVVAGHVLECGPQATGGNYPFLAELGDHRRPGFPLAEIADDGSAVITKHPGTGGTVSVGTVTAQLLYEIGSPHYAGPDVVADFASVRLSAEGPDRVRISGARGMAPSGLLKVALNAEGGYRNTMTLALTGLDIEAKAEHATEMLFAGLGGRESFAETDVRLLRYDRSNAVAQEQATAHLRITVKDPDRRRVGRAFSNAVTELLTSSYSGAYTTTPPTAESAYGIYWPALIPCEVVEQVVVLPDGTRHPVPHTPAGPSLPADPPPAPPGTLTGPTRRVPLGLVCGARSGDKGGDANVGLWVRTDGHYAWLRSYLTVRRLRRLLPEAADLEIRRYELTNLRALNFVIVGLLGEGVAATSRPDPQAKGLAEFIRSRFATVPRSLLEGSGPQFPEVLP